MVNIFDVYTCTVSNVYGQTSRRVHQYRRPGWSTAHTHTSEKNKSVFTMDWQSGV